MHFYIRMPPASREEPPQCLRPDLPYPSLPAIVEIAPAYGTPARPSAEPTLDTNFDDLKKLLAFPIRSIKPRPRWRRRRPRSTLRIGILV